MKRCKNCENRFEPRFSSLERFCWSPECKTMEAMEKLSKIKAMEVKKQKSDLKKRKEALETIQQMVKRVQKVVNKYVRLRDKGKRCCSCDRILTGKFDAGHFYPAGSCWSLRFDAERNIFAQCVHCNRWKHGSLIEYRKFLLQKLGAEELEKMDIESRQHRKYTKTELNEILSHYQLKIKQLNESNNLN